MYCSNILLHEDSVYGNKSTSFMTSANIVRLRFCRTKVRLRGNPESGPFRTICWIFNSATAIDHLVTWINCPASHYRGICTPGWLCKTSQFFKDLYFFCEDRQHESSTETFYMCWAENREKKPGPFIGFLFSKSVCTSHNGCLISNKWHTQYFVSVPNCMQMLIHLYFNGFIFFLPGFWVDITGLDAYPSPSLHLLRKLPVNQSVQKASFLLSK